MKVAVVVKLKTQTDSLYALSSSGAFSRNDDFNHPTKIIAADVVK